jgi:hypothetical protein
MQQQLLGLWKLTQQLLSPWLWFLFGSLSLFVLVASAVPVPWALHLKYATFQMQQPVLELAH